jgi:8-oxo-dGTP pyrophosphatase MutT (NUDIX family)
MGPKCTIGVFAWIFDPKGNILLRKRGPEETYPGVWNLPGGAYEGGDIIGSLLRKVEEKTGLKFNPEELMPAPNFFPTAREGDVAMAILIGETESLPTKGHCKFYSLEEIEGLTKENSEEKMLSGLGSRMDKMTRAGIKLWQEIEGKS